IFLTSLLTNVMGPGPAAVATSLVPDMDHFRGSFGARAVIPLWCNASGTQPNVADGLLDRLSEGLGLRISAEMLLAYCYAVLGTRGRLKSSLDDVRARWTAALSRERLELLGLLEATLDIEPALDAALEQIGSGGCCQACAGVSQQVADGLRPQWS